jgi:amidase
LAKSAKPATDLLAGKTIAIKDNICMAGVPMTAGTQPGYMSRTAAYPISAIDAPVVARVLEAGVTIAGVAVCENYSASGTGVTSATGPVQNPWLKGYMTGGSSSGCGSLVGLEMVRKWREKRGMSTADLPPGVDMAIGGDQGGSIRLVSHTLLSLVVASRNS